MSNFDQVKQLFVAAVLAACGTSSGVKESDVVFNVQPNHDHMTYVYPNRDLDGARQGIVGNAFKALQRELNTEKLPSSGLVLTSGDNNTFIFDMKRVDIAALQAAAARGRGA